MTTIATLAVKLMADSAGFLATMDQAERKSQTWSQNVSNNLRDVGGKMTSFGQQATMGLTLPIAGAGIAAINYASDLEETKNKVSVVFKGMSDDVLAWSQNAATAMGMSQEQALAAAGTYGNLFVSLGLGDKPAADMSTNLVQLASDLASFNNANPQDVLDALRSGLSGEIEPLKKYGVAMNEAIMKQVAMEMGLGDNIQALSEAEKLQIRYAIIMRQTTTAQGDFARTADGLANQQRILKAQFIDAAAALGQKLLPYALQFVTWVSDLIAKFQALSPEQQKWLLIILGVAAALGPVLMVVGSLVTALGAIIPVITAVGGVLLGPVGLAIGIIVGLIALLYAAWTNNWGGIRDTLMQAWANLQPIFEMLRQWLSVAIPAALQWLSNLWTGTLLPALQAVWNFLSTYIFPLLGAIGGVIMAVVVNSIRQWAAFIGNVLVPKLQELWKWIEENILPTLQKFAAWVSEKVSPALRGIGDAIKDVIGWLQGLADKIMKLSLPAWLTPGSPTPWEIGLRGVGSALDELSRKQLPGFSAELAMSAVPAGVGGGEMAFGGSGGGGGNVFNINVTSDGITDERDVARKIASAVDVLLRERKLA